MKTQDILKNNKMIMEFMLLTEAYFKIDEVLYHKSWGWLMPVVEKIEGMYPVLIERAYCRIEADGEGAYFENNTGDKLLSTYKTIVQFINWHNENK